MSRQFDIAMWVKVDDPVKLLEHALSIAMKPAPDGHPLFISLEAAREELTDEGGEPNIHACLQMVLDPGESPPGVSIEECSVEELDVQVVDLGDEDRKDRGED
jgi:hypothetical protein